MQHSCYTMKSVASRIPYMRLTHILSLAELSVNIRDLNGSPYVQFDKRIILRWPWTLALCGLQPVRMVWAVYEVTLLHGLLWCLHGDTKQRVGAWPGGRCYMPPSRIITDYIIIIIIIIIKIVHKVQHQNATDRQYHRLNSSVLTATHHSYGSLAWLCVTFFDLGPMTIDPNTKNSSNDVDSRNDVPFVAKIATFHTPWSPGSLQGHNLDKNLDLENSCSRMTLKVSYLGFKISVLCKGEHFRTVNLSSCR